MPFAATQGLDIFFLQKVLGKLRRNYRLWLCALGFATLHAGEGKVLSDEGLQKKSLFCIKGKQMSPMPEKPDCMKQSCALGPLANKAGSIVIHASTYACFGVEISVKDSIILKKEL